MTTLPESTSIRVRPQGNGVPAVPAPSSIASPAGGLAGPPALTGADVWRVLRGNLWLILGSLIASIALGVVLNKLLQRYAPSYTAFGLIKIEPNIDPDPLAKPERVDMNTLSIEQRTQSQLLKHEGLYAKLFADADGAVRQTSWFSDFQGDAQRAKNALMSGISVSPIPDSKLIRISFTAPTPRDAQAIVRAVGDQHIRDQQGGVRNTRLERSTSLTSMKEQYERRLNEIGRELREKSVQLNIDGMGAPGRLSTREIELGDLVKKQLDAEMSLAEAQGQLQVVEAQLNRGETPVAVDDIASRDPLLAQIRQSILMAETDVSDLAITLGEENPRVRERRERIRSLQAQYEQKLAQEQGRAQLAILDQLRTAVSTREQQLSSVAQRVDALKKDMGTLNNAMATFLTLKEDESKTREQLDQVNAQLDMIRQASNQANQGLVEWAGSPELPEQPTFPKLATTLALCVLAGLGLSLGTAFLRELTDNSVRSPVDIARVGQLNLLGIVPHIADDPKAAGARLPLVIFEAPGSAMADQFRQIRTRLQYSTPLDSTRTLMVTSPSMDDGKTTVAANLAAGLALNGRRILLVDADFRRPSVHTVFSIPNGPGFADALQDATLLPTLAQPTTVPNLSALTAGQRPDNATELLESNKLAAFLDAALGDYDHVIFDSGSVMLVSESMALAPRVDGVVTVVRASANSRGLLSRMRDTLKQVKAEHVGVILNGVRSHNGGYYGRNIRNYYAYQQERAEA